MSKTLTAALAVIKVGGKAIAYVRDVTCTESIARGRVKGIGSLNAKELPANDWTGTCSLSAFTIRFDETFIPKALIRKVSSPEDFVNFVLLQEDGITIDLLRKVKEGEDAATGIPIAGLISFASITGMFVTRNGFSIQESNISTSSMEFEYINPIIYAV